MTNNNRKLALGLSGVLFLGMAGGASAQSLPPLPSLTALEPVLETVEGVANNLGTTLGLTSVIGEGSAVNSLLDNIAGEKNEADDPTGGDIGGNTGGQVLGLLSSVSGGVGGHAGGGIDSTLGGLGGGAGGHLGLPDLLP